MSGYRPTEDERTTEVGLYHFARSYKAAADQLAKAPRLSGSTHPDAPIEFLYTHAVELYLKAFLRLHGLGVAELKKVGHDIPALGKLVSGHGVIFDDDNQRVLDLLTSDNVFGSRYIVTGPYRRASTAGLQMVTKFLHGVTRDALKARGRVCAD